MENGYKVLKLVSSMVAMTITLSVSSSSSKLSLTHLTRFLVVMSVVSVQITPWLSGNPVFVGGRVLQTYKCIHESIHFNS